MARRYLLNHETADLFIRRYDFSFMRMNLTQFIPMPLTKQDPGWDTFMMDFKKARNHASTEGARTRPGDRPRCSLSL